MLFILEIMSPLLYPAGAAVTFPLAKPTYLMEGLLIMPIPAGYFGTGIRPRAPANAGPCILWGDLLFLPFMAIPPALPAAFIAVLKWKEAF